MIRSLDRFTRNIYPGVFCAAVILLLTGLPGSFLPKPKTIIGLDKLAHLLMYFAFAYITLWGYRKPYQDRDKAYRRKALIITLTVGLAYGALTEIMQEAFIPGRVGSLYDWFADAVGTLLGVLFFYFFNQNRNKLKNESFHK